MTLATKTEFAKTLGMHKSYVTRLGDAGRLVMVGGKVDVEASQRLIASTADPGKDHVAERHAQGRTAAPPAALDQNEGAGKVYQQSRAINEKYKALTAKAEYERAIGKLLDRDDVNAALDDVVSFARQGIENLPHQIASEIKAEVKEMDYDKIVAILKQAIVTRMGDMHREAGKRLAELTSTEG
jgi:hypothetical protein